MLGTNEKAYLAELTQRVETIVGDDLAGLYLFGSAAYGGYRPGLSDLDVQAVIAAPLGEGRRSGLVEQLRHDRLPCPAGRLELVVYTVEAVAWPRRPLPFELNLNTGSGLRLHVSTDPGAEPNHWFLLDVAIGRELGRALSGPSPAVLFTQIPRSWQLQAIVESLDWQRRHEPRNPATVLNACRSLRYVETERWASKPEAAAWVRARRPEWKRTIDAALEASVRGLELPNERAAARLVAGVHEAATLVVTLFEDEWATSDISRHWR